MEWTRFLLLIPTTVVNLVVADAATAVVAAIESTEDTTVGAVDMVVVEDMGGIAIMAMVDGVAGTMVMEDMVADMVADIMGGR